MMHEVSELLTEAFWGKRVVAILIASRGFTSNRRIIKEGLYG